MNNRSTQAIGRRVVTTLTGEELLGFEYGGEVFIRARDLRNYLGGQVPAIRLEQAGESEKMSAFPNAEFNMREGDVLTGVQNGANVNFSRAQILAPLVEILDALVDEAVEKRMVKK